jgi:hypothetical protein
MREKWSGRTGLRGGDLLAHIDSLNRGRITIRSEIYKHGEELAKFTEQEDYAKNTQNI